MTAAVLGVATLGALVACDSATEGQPKPTETGSQSSETSSEPTTSESEEPEYSLARLCELLSSDEAEELGGSAEGEKGNSLRDGHAICTWENETSLMVGFQEGVTTANVDTGPSITNTPTEIDGLPAVQSLNTDTVVSCDVLVDLPSGRLVHATAGVLSAGEGKYDPCEVANQMANLIIPRVKDQ
ncbi:DUF3558 domain-containing protein [Actinophytocola algeriensis]|uniref:DUF3558 domain-containing protein n=1 Tax=Actinophytocola algeriensis TaxID=1768010 RepID=A0A7W7VEG5_9PSEU|nr:DUF3558 domain-containing protein [Actinophytocola algeriensis]MBB4907212.1 hypothetical protein [Actinophytocola algeriensis]MBE1478695.1 hypothetical protein [Actinophytocola algeriensis]